MGMFGALTRSVVDFYPTRLLCKRFGVPPPPHVRQDGDAADDRGKDKRWQATYEPSYASSQQQLLPQSADAGMRNLQLADDFGAGAAPSTSGPPGPPVAGGAHPASYGLRQTQLQDAVVVEPDRNAALEGKRAAEDVFKAIFGDSDDEE